MVLKEDKNILKFCFYGFFKNLKFFEPFLYIYFIEMGLSFLQIGVLISIREITKNILEVPSGIYADNFGRKKSLKICFIFYIFSFILFFWGINFIVVALAMILFGVGEAFRSGTHKAIIFTYLDFNGLTDKKVEVYGRTRSYSLLGSSLSAIIGAIIVFIKSNYRLIFLLSIIPYILDFLLINSYPEYLNGITGDSFNFHIFIEGGKNSFKNLKELVHLRRGLFNSSIFNGYFQILKDYLQPILKSQIMYLSLFAFIPSEEKRLSIMLGSAYFIINLFSSFSSRNAYKLKRHFSSSSRVLNLIFLMMVFIWGVIGLFTLKGYSILIIISYLLLYILRNLRRPFMLDYIDNIMDKAERATMLSIESQLTTLIIVALAPILGFIADNMGLWVMFIFSFITMFIAYLLTSISEMKGCKA